jgi:hypothetical protein
LIEFLEPGKTINAARYVQTLIKLRRALCDKHPGRKVILQHDNARLHTASLSFEKIETWGILPEKYLDLTSVIHNYLLIIIIIIHYYLDLDRNVSALSSILVQVLQNRLRLFGL